MTTSNTAIGEHPIASIPAKGAAAAYAFPARPLGSAETASRFGRLRKRIPLTARGLCVLIFSFYLIAGPSWNASDVVATVVGYSLLLLIGGFTLITFVQSVTFREQLRAKLSAELFDASAGGTTRALPIAGTPTRVVVSTSEVSLVPMTLLEMEVRFLNPGVRTARHLIAGRSQGGRTLIEDMVFPHRGAWQISALAFSLSDMWGLTDVAWEDKASVAGIGVEVRPAPHSGAQVPLISSAVRAGDSIADLLDRQGDPYDIKQHNPADGMKRILWKVFAKRGELISRLPERAVTPEGQVVCFVVANPAGDAVCSEAVHYANAIAEVDLQLWVGCEGMGERASARDAASLEDLLIETVWDSAHTSTETLCSDLTHLLSEVRETVQHARIDKIILLLAEERFKDETSLELHTKLGNMLEQDGIAPVFVPLGASGKAALPKGAMSQVERLFVHQDSTDRPRDPAFFKRFLGICASRGWEVIMQQHF